MRLGKLGWTTIAALAVSALGAVYQQNIQAFAAQHHLDVIIFRLVGPLTVFCDSWLGAFCVGVLATCALLVVVNALKTWLDERDRTANPLALDFDVSNPDYHYWNTRYVGQSDDYYSEKIVHYRIKITNRTRKTIKGLRVKRIFRAGHSDLLGLSAEGKEWDIHPGDSDFVNIFTYDEMGEIMRENEPDYEHPRSFRLQVSGVDINTCERTVVLNFENDCVVTVKR